LSEIVVSNSDRVFINRLRGFSILRVVLAHLGLAWIFLPYSQMISTMLPSLFFVSGAVSFSSFTRANDKLYFLKRRLMTLVIPIYLVVFLAFLTIFVFTQQWLFSLDGLSRWLLLNPRKYVMPFPLGQVWFLHTLALLVLISFPLFYFSLKKKVLFNCVIVCSILLSVSQIFYEIGPMLIIHEHNLFKPLVFIGFYLFGALWISNVKDFEVNKCFIACLVCIVISVGLFLVSDASILMADHVYFPDGYYVFLSYAMVFLFLATKIQINYILDHLYWLDRFLIFVSKYAYGIFILHSLMIYLVEEYLDLRGVFNTGFAIVLKIIIVITASCIFAVPLSKLSNKCLAITLRK